ncbi:MAG: ATP-dependent DNA helicase RecG [Pseudomonadota bacterium]
MTRPEILFPLFAEITTLDGVGPRTAALFARIGITRVVDLLFTLPQSAVDRRLRDGLSTVEPGQIATIPIEVIHHEPPRRDSQPWRIQCQAPDAMLDVIYFRAKRDWLEGALPLRARRVISGKVERYDGRWQMPHPDHVLREAEADDLPPWEPVYPLTQGLTNRVFARAVASALTRVPALPEWLDAASLAEMGWPHWGEALQRVHRPREAKDLSPAAPARQRLAYDELLSHQLALALVRERSRRNKGRPSRGDGVLRRAAATAFPFPPTGAQARGLDAILEDMASDFRMLRLLQGDVGAGKTWVALMAMLAAVEAGGQGALMAPTEILARQHGAGLAPIAEAAGVDLRVLTGRDKGAQRAEILAAIEGGQAGLVIGTHALFQPDVRFHDLRLAVIDEQHRFGVRQRAELTAKAPAGCDVLVMTATPIPRTLALAGYGDMDLSILDEKPPGRQPVETRLVSMERYAQVVDRLAAAVAEGRQAYWVCPAVEEGDHAKMAVEARHRALAERFGARVALVHGQLPPEVKDAAMAAFKSGEAQILVATTVIEVGVDVPNATIMVIEQPETFGLAQLHQLRGRVGRGSGASSCVLLFQPPLGETARARLEVLRSTEDGFRIADEDLRLRGSGDPLGPAQSGLPRFRIADLQADGALMKRAHDAARYAVAKGVFNSETPDNTMRTLLYLMERESSVRLMRSA